MLLQATIDAPRETQWRELIELQQRQIEPLTVLLAPQHRPG